MRSEKQLVGGEWSNRGWRRRQPLDSELGPLQRIRYDHIVQKRRVLLPYLVLLLRLLRRAAVNMWCSGFGVDFDLRITLLILPTMVLTLTNLDVAVLVTPPSSIDDIMKSETAVRFG
uniref:Uncharacterized protein n=1 Tax=Kalanchoe fedtschenkoi TaxID=63787 RepID=A0A7N0VD61_KALFE